MMQPNPSLVLGANSAEEKKPAEKQKPDPNVNAPKFERLTEGYEHVKKGGRQKKN